MKSYHEFDLFCKSKLQPNLDKLSIMRSAIVKKIIIIRLFLGLMVIGVVGFMILAESFIYALESNIFLLISAVLFLIAYIILFIFLYKHQLKIKLDFIYDFKNEIINNIIKFFDESLTYKPFNFISFEEFTSSGLVPRKIDRYYGDDYVEGKIGNTSIKFSEVHAFIEEKSGKNTTYVEVFGGILFVADFNKNFTGRTYVLPDKMERSLGRFSNFLQGLIRSYGELVKLEDIDFEKQFMVYSSDQVEARYILSTSMMQRMMDYQKKANSDLMMAFVNSHIYIALPIRGRLFEPKIFGRLTSEETLRNYYEHLHLTFSCVEDLNLNLRIWSKE